LVRKRRASRWFIAAALDLDEAVEVVVAHFAVEAVW
jgi:hypothetical protein